MRVFAAVLTLSVMLPAAPTFAQAAAQPAAQGQKPATGQTAPAPARPQPQTPPAAQQPAPQAPAPVPFKDGFKYAYINIQAIASQSADGRAATAEIKKLSEQRQKELTEKQKALQTAQQKLESSSSIVSDSARASQQAEIERMQRDIERSAEDAEQDVQRLTQRLQQEFMVKLNPVIDRVAKAKGVDLVFNAAESGLVWAAPGMDLTLEVITSLDGPGAAKPAAAAPATPSAPPPAAAAPAPTTPPAPAR